MFVFKALNYKIPQALLDWYETQDYKSFDFFELVIATKINNIINKDNTELKHELSKHIPSLGKLDHMDITELKSVYEACVILKLSECKMKISTHIKEIKNTDGGWGITGDDSSDLLSTNFSIDIIADFSGETFDSTSYESTINLVNNKATNGGYTHIISDEPQILSNFHFSDINNLIDIDYSLDINSQLEDFKNKTSELNGYNLYFLLETATLNGISINDELLQNVQNYIDE